jgi:hypothetical protein
VKYANKVIVTMPEGRRFHVDFLNPDGELVAKLGFDHNQENRVGHFIKYWLEHNELRPADGVDDLEFHPERLGDAFHVSKLKLLRIEDDWED